MFYFKYITFLTGAFLLFSPARAQTGADTTYFNRLVSQKTSDLSFITALGGIGSIDKLWLEGRLVPWVFVIPPDNGQELAIAPQIVLRLFQGNSAPVRAPSYMPRIRYRHYNDEKQRILSVLLSHHSNGQTGDFIQGDSLNLNSGSFSNNFLKFGRFRYRNSSKGGEGYIWGIKKLEWWKAELEVPLYIFWKDKEDNNKVKWLPINREPGLEGLYSFWRVHTAFQLDKTSIPFPFFIYRNGAPETLWIFSNITQRIEASWRLPLGVEHPGKLSSQLDLSYTWLANIFGLDDFQVFVNYYSGEDYYNMRFQRRLNVLRFGLKVNLGNFKLQQSNIPLPAPL